MDWVAAFLVILSTWMTGRKNKWGWLVGIVSAGIFITIALDKKIYGMIALDIFLITLNIINFIKWNKDDKRKIHMVRTKEVL